MKGARRVDRGFSSIRNNWL